MRRQRGFTIVELVVVLTIMAILLTLSVVGFNTAQVNARDGERKADAEAIARGLEVRYKQGNSHITSSPNDTATEGGYPGVVEWLHMIKWGDQSGNGFSPGYPPEPYLSDALPGTTPSNFVAPGKTTGFDIYCFFCPNGAEDATYLATRVTKDSYIYEPLQADGTQCNGERCVRYNLYYRTEADNVLHTIRSEHQ